MTKPTMLEPEVPQPLRVALNQIVGESIPMCLYEDKADFDRLWGFVEKSAVLTEGALIVVASDDPLRGDETGARSLDPWITVDAWIMAFALAHRDTEIPCVYLLDLRTGEHPLRDDLGKEKLGDFLRRFLPKPSRDGHIEFLDDFRAEIVNAVSARKLGSTVTSGLTDGIKLFNLIRRHAVRDINSFDRHDKSNEIGAMIMRAGLPTGYSKPGNENSRERAIRILIEAMLVEVGKDSKHQSVHYPIIKTLLDDEKSKLNKHIFIPNNLSIYLVDDRHEAGYRTVLSQALGQTIEGCLGIFDSDCEDGALGGVPKRILGTDYSELKKYAEMHSFGADILFLDLRLWRDEESQSKALENYQLYLGGFAPGIPNIDAISGLMANASGNSHRHLAMLPLLIARLDPALPIVLFSSTQHRSVVQAVRDVPSIITDFSKPYIGSGDPDEYYPTTVLDSLRVAVELAAVMVEIRKVWREACRQWKDKRVCELHWAKKSGWDTVAADPDPLFWLREEWLPLAQQGQYALAAAAPWLYLNRVLREVRIEILCSKDAASKEEQDCLAIIRNAQHMPLLDRISAAEARELAIVAGLALVRLISIWSKQR